MIVFIWVKALDHLSVFIDKMNSIGKRRDVSIHIICDEITNRIELTDWATDRVLLTTSRPRWIEISTYWADLKVGYIICDFLFKNVEVQLDCVERVSVIIVTKDGIRRAYSIVIFLYNWMIGGIFCLSCFYEFSDIRSNISYYDCTAFKFNDLIE